MMFVKKGEEIFEPKEALLLDDLRINMRGAESFDLTNKEVPDTFDCL